MTNPYLTIEELNKYCPQMLLKSLFDYYGNKMVSDEAVQRAIDDALPWVLGINPDITNADLLRQFSARFVMVQAWRQMTKYEKALEEEKLLIDTIRRTTGKASQDPTQSAGTPAFSGETAWVFER